MRFRFIQVNYFGPSGLASGWHSNCFPSKVSLPADRLALIKISSVVLAWLCIWVNLGYFNLRVNVTFKYKTQPINNISLRFVIVSQF